MSKYFDYKKYNQKFSHVKYYDEENKKMGRKEGRKMRHFKSVPIVLLSFTTIVFNLIKLLAILQVKADKTSLKSHLAKNTHQQVIEYSFIIHTIH